MLPAGKSLRTLREKLGLTMRDVETSSARIAEKYRNEEFTIPPSRLSDIETKGILPSIYRLYTLSVIYRRDLRELLSWYGVDMNNMAADLGMVSPPKSHVSDALAGLVQRAGSAAHGSRASTSAAPPISDGWSSSGDWFPFAYLAQFANSDFTYGYVGTQDFTMYPILPPGSFIQVDEAKNKVVEGSWRSEYERPIYFVETRDGHTCCWCSMRREEHHSAAASALAGSGANPSPSPGCRSAGTGGGRGYEVDRVARSRFFSRLESATSTELRWLAGGRVFALTRQ